MADTPTKWSRAWWAGVLLAVAGVLTTAAHLLWPTAQPINPFDAAPPIEERFGWAGKEAADAAWQAIGDQFPRFRITGVQGDNTKRRVVLWDAAKKVNGGKHLTTVRQEIGSCVGSGMQQALQYLLCVQIASGQWQEYHTVFMPYHYACGRCAPECGHGGMGRDPSGSTGAWQALAVKLYGVLPTGLPGLPAGDGNDRATASKWAVRMPPAEWVEKGKLALVKTAAKLNSTAEVRDALCNGYPCTIASDWGGKMNPPTVDGRLVNTRADHWSHQMCVVGYDGSASSGNIYWYILNSWGPNAHGPPPDDSPPGGFWVNERDLACIVRQGETFALSQWDGFPAQDLDWNVLPRQP